MPTIVKTEKSKNEINDNINELNDIDLLKK